MLLVARQYWCFLDPIWHRRVNGQEQYEFLKPFTLKEDYDVIPVSMIDSEMFKLLLEQMGLDANTYRYKLEQSLLLTFKERKNLLAYVLKFRDELIVWRKD